MESPIMRAECRSATTTDLRQRSTATARPAAPARPPAREGLGHGWPARRCVEILTLDDIRVPDWSWVMGMGTSPMDG